MIGKPRILFVFSDTGGGHRSAAEAIIEALEIEYGDQISTEMVDFFKDYCPWPFRTFPDTYPAMVKIPRAWGSSYKLTNGRRRVATLRRIGYTVVRAGFRRLVAEHPCDLIVPVHSISIDALLRVFEDPRPPMTVVVTDLVTTHSFWYHRKADVTVVPTEAAYQHALMEKLEPESVQLIGLPVADRFCRPARDFQAIRERLGWPLDLSIVVLVGGGDGMGPLEKTARAIAESGLQTGLVVIAGRNQALKSQLETYDWEIPVFIYGFVCEMPDFMRAADVLVTKAGPGTISEALNAGLPMVLFDYLPGQETGNVSYVVEGGAGVWAPKPEQIVSAVRAWLMDPEAHSQAVQACKRMARPDASRQIARLLASQVGVYA